MLFKFKTCTCEIVEKMLVLAVGKEGKGQGRRTPGTETVKGGCVKEVCPIADLLNLFFAILPQSCFTILVSLNFFYKKKIECISTVIDYKHHFECLLALC